MTKHEVDALLGYIEFNLTTMVERIEQKVKALDSDGIGTIYDEAYEVLHEIERTLADGLEVPLSKSPKVDKK